uniref:Uncharacterized protein n=1 Tax=Arundo donax TaxID=35708 RepID=A0A0A9EMV6_ARUDO
MKNLTREGLGSCVSTLRETLFECQRSQFPWSSGFTRS